MGLQVGNGVKRIKIGNSINGRRFKLLTAESGIGVCAFGCEVLVPRLGSRVRIPEVACQFPGMGSGIWVRLPVDAVPQE
jgi:hypothetical protein